ncbi:MAG: spermidine/putrescine ABC transporter permease PotC [Candidatus Thermofonsia Clade 1 bacterium]|uniref:Spermidine/putrescine ABC transporter permease PotC n=1 Tax=Candidatus Thermofonsia Clade 1 bacterium TaxID=2364210 RepID=A0A2M8PGF5_9CHLR|nr:MAG: spermidine/putrescine ABC transporter permease PotC [Candidatus Thermofonsia Clade 1 bacterium]RMF49591.1 MAG: ABC transporter permease [Chloroflexota bacterium]
MAPRLADALRGQVRAVTRLGLPVISLSVFIFLYAPILVLVIFSFNSGTRLGVWEGFSLRWYERVFSSREWLGALQVTLWIAIGSTLIATVLGTLAGLALERFRFRGKRAYDSMLYLPVIIPDIVMALSLLLFFSAVNVSLSRWTVLIGHVAFNTAFVAVIIRARLASLDSRLEEAAADLYASPWQAFRRVTLPLLRPAILAGALMAFTMSFDEFVITSFVSGQGDTTLPVKIYASIRFGLKPEITAVASLVLLISVLLVIASLLMQRGTRKSVQMFN